MNTKFDRGEQSAGNIVHMEHVNLMIPEQPSALLFYITGLQLTRDPYLMTGLDNMWINMGRSQFHLPRRDPSPQILRGTIGLVVPDLDATETSLNSIKEQLTGSAFSFERKSNYIEAICPWGNKLKIHEPAAEYGSIQLGMPYVEISAPKASSEKIARFYKEILGAKVSNNLRHGAPCASITTGAAQFIHFVETDIPQPDYDGHHVAIYIADFATPYRKLRERDLISRESDEHEWRFIDVIDLDTNEAIFQIEHEVRSVTHPLYARPLVNRNPAQSNRSYHRGQDGFLGEI